MELLRNYTWESDNDELLLFDGLNSLEESEKYLHIIIPVCY